MKKSKPWYYLALLGCAILASFLVYGNAIKGDFVYDDTIVLTAPNLLQASSLPSLLVSPYHYHFPQSGIYRPLTSISFALNFILFGSSPASFHVVNILLHALICFVIVLLLRELLKDDFQAYAIGALFLVLPIHIEAVTSVVGRGELLWTLFGLLMLLYRKNTTLSLFLFFCALLSKETAISLIPLTGFFYITVDNYQWRTAIRKTLCYVVPLGCYFALRYAALGNNIFSNNADIVYNPLKFAPLGARIVTALKILGLYVQKIVAPYNLVSDYSYNQIAVSSHLGVRSVLGLVIFSALVIGCVKYKRYSRIAITCAMFLCPYFIISNLFYKTGTIMAERLMYMSSLGLVILFVMMGDRIIKSASMKKTLLGFVLLVYIITTISHNRVWLTQEALSRDAYAKSPNSILTQLGMAQVDMSHGDVASAKALLLKANALYDKDVEVLNLLGVIAWQEKRYAEAETYFNKVLALRPAYTDTLVNLSRMYYQEGNYKASAEVLASMHAQYGTAMGFQNMRLYLLLENMLGNYDRVIGFADVADSQPDIQFLIGYAYLKKGDSIHAQQFLGSYKGSAIATHFQEIANDFK